MQNSLKKRILFIGVPDMAYACFDALLKVGTNIVGAIGDTKKSNTYAAFKEFVHARGVHFIDYDKLDDPEFLENLRKLDIDLAVVCSFNLKLPKCLLEVPKDGIINVHPSLLPEYRGGNAYSKVIANGENETGVTIHYMCEEFDTGDIICQKSVKIDPKETMGTLFNLLNLVGCQLLQEVIKAYETHKLPRTPQPKGAFKPGNNFKDEELTIDFTKSAKELERFVRALNPFIVANTSFRGNFVRIYSADCLDKKTTMPVGAIEKVDKNNIYIATGEGLLVPETIQFGSYFLSSIKDFIKLVQPKIGEKFGQ